MAMQSRKLRLPKLTQEGLEDKIPVTGQINKGVLRQKAEKLLKKRQSDHSAVNVISSGEGRGLRDAETKRVIYELEVHQIELELQNLELQHAKEQNEALADKYTQLYDFSPAGYFTLSREGAIIDLNLYGSKLLGKDRIKLRNSLFGFFVTEDSRIEFNHFIDCVFQSGCKASCDVTLSPENGNSPVELSLTGIISEDRDKCLVAAIDISDRKRAEAEVIRKNIELQRVNAEKDRFFSIIAHDLRSPFNGFLGLTELMAESLSGMTFDEIHKMVMMMKNGANNLNQLLGNLLEWSRMERGMFVFAPKSCLLGPRIDQSLSSVRESAAKKRITIDCQIPEDTEVCADDNMIESLFRNLLSNAIKFTASDGQIRITSAPFSKKYIEFRISDTGIGMDKNLIDNLFRLDVNIGRKGTEGELSTGLGLIICKEIIDKHQGKIWVESEEQVGTVFHFTLPIMLI